jgi:transcriptional regulator NrdR family protein
LRRRRSCVMCDRRFKLGKKWYITICFLVS